MKPKSIRVPNILHLLASLYLYKTFLFILQSLSVFFRFWFLVSFSFYGCLFAWKDYIILSFNLPVYFLYQDFLVKDIFSFLQLYWPFSNIWLWCFCWNYFIKAFVDNFSEQKNFRKKAWFLLQLNSASDLSHFVMVPSILTVVRFTVLLKM